MMFAFKLIAPGVEGSQQSSLAESRAGMFPTVALGGEGMPQEVVAIPSLLLGVGFGEPHFDEAGIDAVVGLLQQVQQLFQGFDVLVCLNRIGILSPVPSEFVAI